MAFAPSAAQATPDVRVALAAVLQLEQMWEGCAVGVALTAAYFENRGVTADSLSAKIPTMSPDTARRRLKRLADLGRALYFCRHRQHFYHAAPVSAEETNAAAEPDMRKTAYSAANCNERLIEESPIPDKLKATTRMLRAAKNRLRSWISSENETGTQVIAEQWWGTARLKGECNVHNHRSAMARLRRSLRLLPARLRTGGQL